MNNSKCNYKNLDFSYDYAQNCTLIHAVKSPLVLVNYALLLTCYYTCSAAIWIQNALAMWLTPKLLFTNGITTVSTTEIIM